MSHYVVTAVGQEDFFIEQPHADWEGAASAAVEHWNLKRKHNEPEARIEVTVYRLEPKNGKMTRRWCCEKRLPVPSKRLSTEEFESELAKVLDRLPAAFRSFVASQSWVRGHSAGYEEVLMIAEDLATKLEDVIKKFISELSQDCL